jgi:quercetin dioxygenase-like cupin family protein
VDGGSPPGHDTSALWCRAAGRSKVPWHLHTEVCDTFYLVRGPVTIYTRVPDETSIGETGDTVQVPAGQAHRVVNESDHDVATILIQGVGTYDFRPVLE